MRETIFCCALLTGLLMPGPVQAQQTGNITGMVTSSAQQPLSGVSVSIRGTDLVVLSGGNGRYTINNVPIGRHILEAAPLGYTPRELPVTVEADATVVLNIELDSRAIVLEQIVAVGYGTQRREEVTGAVASVSAAEFVAGPARDAASLIAGKLPGLAV